MDESNRFALEQSLPETLPADPLPLFLEWFEEAKGAGAQPNPDGMTLASATPEGVPSARIVLCRKIVLDPGFIVFYTNRESRKGRELDANPRAAALFHWDALNRQVRIEGPVTRSPDEESDAYFNQRRWESRIGAWASHQSQPLEDREALLERAGEYILKFGVDIDHPERATIPRPPHWGGYRIWAQRVELWVGQESRYHDRARWERELVRAGDEFKPGAWRGMRLQP